MKNTILLLSSYAVLLFCEGAMLIAAEITLTRIQESQKEKELIDEIPLKMYRNIVPISPGNIFHGGSGAFRWDLKTYPRNAITKQSLETGEVSEHDISSIYNETTLDHIVGINRPWGCMFNISPDDRYVLVRPYGRESIVYDTQENRTVGFYANGEDFQKERQWVKLGFDKEGNMYCGTQDITPMFFLSKFPTGGGIRQYRFQINYVPDKFIPTQVGELNQFKLGFIYNYLQTPLESPNGKYTAFSFTLFQFQYMYAVVLVCDNKTWQPVSKQFVSTSNWNYHTQHFAFSPDEKYFYFQDGHNEICRVDLEQRLTTSRFTAPSQPDREDRDRFINRDFVIDTFFLTPEGNVVIQTTLSDYFYQRLPTFSPSSESAKRPQILTALWNPVDNTVTYPRPWVKEGAYTLRHWISPDNKIVATYYIDYDPVDYRIAIRRPEAPDTLAFWDISTGKLLHKIEGNITNVNFSPDWKFVDVTSWKEGEKIIQSNTRYAITMGESR